MIEALRYYCGVLGITHPSEGFYHRLLCNLGCLNAMFLWLRALTPAASLKALRSHPSCHQSSSSLQGDLHNPSSSESPQIHLPRVLNYSFPLWFITPEGVKPAASDRFTLAHTHTQFTPSRSVVQRQKKKFFNRTIRLNVETVRKSKHKQDTHKINIRM